MYTISAIPTMIGQLRFEAAQKLRALVESPESSVTDADLAFLKLLVAYIDHLMKEQGT